MRESPKRKLQNEANSEPSPSTALQVLFANKPYRSDGDSSNSSTHILLNNKLKSQSCVQMKFLQSPNNKHKGKVDPEILLQAS
jgi:hypothetical protein